MKEKVLFVDDDSNILDGYKRYLRKKFDIEAVTSGDLGIEAIRGQGPFSVVISDYQMPGMDGVTFLSKVRELNPDIVRMVITGYADLQIAMDAVNEGHIFRFLTKPCKPELLEKAVEDGIRQYRLIQKTYELRETRHAAEVLKEARERLEKEVAERTADLERLNNQLMREIGERTLAEISALESKSILQRVLDNIPHSIYWKDHDGVFQGCNLNFLKLVEDEKILGKRLEQVSMDTSLQEFMKERESLMLSTGVPEFGLFEGYRDDGSVLYLDTSILPYHDSEGEFLGMIGMLEDVTEKMWAEEERIRYERSRSALQLADSILNELDMPLERIEASGKMMQTVDRDNPLFDYFLTVQEEIDSIALIKEKLKSITEQ